MSKRLTDKCCELCNKEIYNVDISTKYCEECKRIAVNLSHKKGRNAIPYKLRTKEYYGSHLNKIADEPFKLTPVYFNEHSSISVKSYTNFFKMNWVDVLKELGRFDELYDYIVLEFKTYTNSTNKNKVYFAKFTKNHKYINYRLANMIGVDSITSDAGAKITRYSDEDFKNNIMAIKSKLGRMPLFHEFNELSFINFYSYANRLKLSGTIYDEIIKYYSTDEEYLSYTENKISHKSKIGYETGRLSATYSNEDYEKEIHRVFEHCINEYGEIPTRRLFNQLSTIDESAYRGKYNKSWTEVCEMFGYEIDKTANKSEKTALEVVKSIIKEDYSPQQTFDWLVGIHNYPLFCDGYYPEHKLIIEFDGIQHRQPVKAYGGIKNFNKQQANDQIKDELIPKNGLKLVRISSEEPFWDKEYIKNKLIENNVI